jgi:hypothetical protein
MLPRSKTYAAKIVPAYVRIGLDKRRISFASVTAQKSDSRFAALHSLTPHLQVFYTPSFFRRFT